jgi:hypothetical protein
VFGVLCFVLRSSTWKGGECVYKQGILCYNKIIHISYSKDVYPTFATAWALLSLTSSHLSPHGTHHAAECDGSTPNSHSLNLDNTHLIKVQRLSAAPRP